MRIAIIFGSVIAVGIVIYILFASRFKVERYEILHTAYLQTTNQTLLSAGGVFYSNKELKDAVRSNNILDQAGISSYNLDAADLIACIAANYTVESVIGRQDFGLIILRQSPTNGISFTVFKGTKRMLQFNYPKQ